MSSGSCVFDLVVLPKRLWSLRSCKKMVHRQHKVCKNNWEIRHDRAIYPIKDQIPLRTSGLNKKPRFLLRVKRCGIELASYNQILIVPEEKTTKTLSRVISVGTSLQRITNRFVQQGMCLAGIVLRRAVSQNSATHFVKMLPYIICLSNQL